MMTSKSVDPGLVGARVPVWALVAVGVTAGALVPAAGSVLGMGSITSPRGLAARTGFGLAAEAVLLAATAAYLKAPSQRPG
jgi:hypothetical protein